MIRLVLSDMDGTLVPFEREDVSARTLAAIDALRAVGIHFGPGTGRPPVDLAVAFGGHEEYYSTGILGNGKLDYVDGRLVRRVVLDHAGLERIVGVAAEFACCACLVYAIAGGEAAGTIEHDELPYLVAPSTSALRAMEGMRVARGGILPELPDYPVTVAAVFFAGPAGEGMRVRTALEEACPEFDFPLPNPQVFDVLPKGWTKAQALPIMEEALGVVPDEIAYFGDSENDLGMMAAIPNSFCVASGSDTALAAARHVIPADVDDGPAQMFEALAASGGELDRALALMGVE